ncbi:MAG TPA: hypothetical protein VFV50_05420, partial [Bdellovibrionales bacterium]|nr:hypothetical protein [Bdellovibrionales bacterium]
MRPWLALSLILATCSVWAGLTVVKKDPVTGKEIHVPVGGPRHEDSLPPEILGAITDSDLFSLERKIADASPRPSDERARAAPDARMTMVDRAMQYTRLIPGIGPLIAEYRSVVRPSAYTSLDSVGVGNTGINSHFAGLHDKSPCLGELTKRFYAQVSELDFKNYPPGDKRPSRRRLEGRPSLQNTTADPDHQDLKPGWAWELALRIAGGDANVAMTIIGTCGHDDTSRGELRYPVRSMDEARAEHGRAGAQLQALYGRVNQALTQAHRERRSPAQIEALDYYLKRLQEAREQLRPEHFQREKLICPANNSNFYLPQSLGAAVDIP